MSIIIRMRQGSGTAGFRAAPEDVIYEIDDVADIALLIAVGVAGFDRVGPGAAIEDMIDQKDGIANVDLLVAVGVAADITDLIKCDGADIVAGAIGIVVSRIGIAGIDARRGFQKRVIMVRRTGEPGVQ
jgi:hypothetical protein